MAKIIDRLLLFLFSLAILITACIMLAAAFNWIPLEVAHRFIEDVYTDTHTAIAFISVCSVMLLISIRLFYLSVRSVNAQPPAFTQSNELGYLRISVDTIENLALKAASRTRGVKDLRARIEPSNAGIEITIRCVVDGESPIPAMSEEIQNAVKQQVYEITGVPVVTVSVFIANVSQSTPTFKSRVE